MRRFLYAQSAQREDDDELPPARLRHLQPPYKGYRQAEYDDVGSYVEHAHCNYERAKINACWGPIAGRFPQVAQGYALQNGS